MKASEMISRLQELMLLHGDLDVRLYDQVEREFGKIGEVQARVVELGARCADDESRVFFGATEYALGDWDVQLAYKDNPEISQANFLAVPSFVCPECGNVSYNPTDIKEQYCGYCHEWFAVRGM